MSNACSSIHISIFAGLAGAFAVSLFAVPLFAQQDEIPGQDIIRTQPSIIEEVVEPGDSDRHIISVTNQSDRTETFYPSVENMRGISDRGTPLFTDEETGFDIAGWVTLEADSITLDPGETGEIAFTIDVPSDAGPRGYYGAFFVTRQAPEQRQTGAAVDFKVGTIINYRIQGDAHEEASIREFFTDKNIYRNGEAVDFTLRVENLGNVLARPRGAATIVNMRGDEVDQVSVNHPRPGGVFPGETRTFEFSWQPEGMQIGRFHVELDLTYGETGRRTISETVSFWVLPINLIIGFLVGLVLFVLAVFFLVRRYIRKQIHAATGGRRASSKATMRAQSAPISKLTLMTIAVVLFTLLFAFVVVFMFA